MLVLWMCSCLRESAWFGVNTRTFRLTIAKTSQKTSRDELTERERRSLKSSANNHDGGTDENSALATEDVTEPDGCAGTEKAAEGIAADGDTLHVG